MYYIPYGYTDPSSINWLTLNPSSLSFSNPGSVSGGYNWQNWGAGSGITYSPQTLQSHAVAAAQSGQQNTSKLMAGILTYGPALVGMAATIIYAIKGRKVSDPLKITDDDAGAVLAYGNGTLDPAALQKLYGDRQAEILGIPLSTIVIILGGIILYQLFTQNQGKKK